MHLDCIYLFEAEFRSRLSLLLLETGIYLPFFDVILVQHTFVTFRINSNEFLCADIILILVLAFICARVMEE